MKLEPTILENRFVRLEPIGTAHREDLRAACAADTSVWRELYPFSWAGEHFDPTWAKLQEDIGSGGALGFAVMVQGVCQGISCYSTRDSANECVEIGGTYYRPEVRSGPVNPAAKRLLLAHAFESGARRAQFKVDAINTRSRAAVLKLGAVQEGVLRQDRVTWTGRVRDTVVYSILAGEWPAVRDGLDARLAAFP